MIHRIRGSNIDVMSLAPGRPGSLCAGVQELTAIRMKTIIVKSSGRCRTLDDIHGLKNSEGIHWGGCGFFANITSQEAKSVPTGQCSGGRSQSTLLTERSMLETSAIFAALIDNIPDFIYVKDTSSRFIVANAHVAHLMGGEPEELWENRLRFLPARVGQWLP